MRPNKHPKLYTNDYAELMTQMSDDYLSCLTSATLLPNKLSYQVDICDEPLLITRSARLAALNKFASQPIVKKAFDTRRIDQEHDRNPRSNLQYWNRTDQFISEEAQGKINIFAKLIHPLDELKTTFGAMPEWHNSYARVLQETVHRVLRTKEADLDIFEPQLVQVTPSLLSSSTSSL